MAISIFELFSIGIGPSSSHTVGPMRAAYHFIESLGREQKAVASLQVTLYGSLAFTGKGHGTDRALLLGFEGEKPETVDPDHVIQRGLQIRETHRLKLMNKHEIDFDVEQDFHFNYADVLSEHSNGMRFRVYNKKNKLLKEEIYYSIGGGFILTEAEIQAGLEQQDQVHVRFPFNSGEELLEHCKRENQSVAEIMLENETAWRSKKEVCKGLLHIAAVMEESIDRGLNAEGFLPGVLHVPRRAPGLYKMLQQYGKPSEQHPRIMSWLDAYAMAANEENSAGGRIVTAPTNGAAGTIPAILRYYKEMCPGATEQGVLDLLLTSGAIGILYKKNASISGAEMGCQGEVGVACSMAAAGLTAALGGTAREVENAAEIGMEHNLGLTCDPVAGLVQIPCIERNAMAAVKAVNAAQLALAGGGVHKVSLDMVINTMREIGQNMNTIYKETSKGGLAVNVPEC